MNHSPDPQFACEQPPRSGSPRPRRLTSRQRFRPTQSHSFEPDGLTGSSERVACRSSFWAAFPAGRCAGAGLTARSVPISRPRLTAEGRRQGQRRVPSRRKCCQHCCQAGKTTTVTWRQAWNIRPEDNGHTLDNPGLSHGDRTGDLHAARTVGRHPTLHDGRMGSRQFSMAWVAGNHRSRPARAGRPQTWFVACDSQWLSWTQATSYWDTAAVLFALANEAVPGLPAYTAPACPLPLNGEPGAVAEEPGVAGLSGPHVLVGAPGWPVVGLTVAHADAGAATSKPAEQASTRTYFRICSSRAGLSGLSLAAGGIHRSHYRLLVHVIRLPPVHGSRIPRSPRRQ